MQRLGDAISNKDYEISLNDIYCFFKEAWKQLALLSFVGFILAVGFILGVTPKYEGVAHVQMAQLMSKSNVNLGVIGVEDPALLMARFKLPSTYTEIEVRACGLEGDLEAKETLAKDLVKINPIKSLGVVELKVLHKSPEQVRNCLGAIFDRIQVTQEAIKEPLLQEALKKININQKQLQEARNFVTRVEKIGGEVSASYLTIREEIRFLQDEIINQKDLIISAEIRKAKLLSPVYVYHEPVFPKKILSLVLGLVAGLFFGILFAMGKNLFVSRS